MKKKRSASSTTKKLQRLTKNRVETAQFFTGFFALLLVILGFCYINDSEFTGIKNPFLLFKTIERSFSLALPEKGIIPIVRYTIMNQKGLTKVIDITRLFYTVLVLVFASGVLNFIVLRLSAISANYNIKKQLSPLYNLARSAQILSEEDSRPAEGEGASQGAYDSSRIHNLESAIDSLKPDLPDTQLETNDEDLKGLENAINSLLLRARKSSDQQIRFVSDASHELRTPIAVIKGYTDMLDRWGKDDEKILAESIFAIKSETEHMNRLVEQLLFLARGDSGRTALKLESFDLSDLAKEVAQEFMMIDRDHLWELEAEENIQVFGDIALLKQALRILADNARKYTPSGGSIKLKAKRDDMGYPCLIVQDSGIGISFEDMPKMFDRFYRSDPARGREKGGTGLGLSIAEWIIDRHEGYFDVLSHESFGTRITMHLPIKHTAAEQ